MARAWALISISERRAYGGNLGYDDAPKSVYRYDSSVPNHRQVRSGDLVFVRDHDAVLGAARIQAITRTDGSKTRRRCPECGTTRIKERTRERPRWRCRDGHAFVEPRTEEVSISMFEASYADTFVELAGALTVADLRSAALRRGGQVSIRELDPQSIAAKIAESDGPFADLFARFMQARRPHPEGIASPEPGFVPTLADTREQITRSIASRKGQRSFRNRLIRRYGASCMVTRCGLIDIVEAAHIWPYRGPKDNHAENGLLLRADIHTLFDLDLLGVEPDSMTVRLHPDARDAGYNCFDALPLHVPGTYRPSRSALRERWVSFMEQGAPD